MTTLAPKQARTALDAIRKLSPQHGNGYLVDAWPDPLTVTTIGCPGVLVLPSHKVRTAEQKVEYYASVAAFEEAYGIEHSPPTPASVPVVEREAFIAWVEKDHPEFSTKGHTDGGFLWATTEGLWQAWQARAALASKPVAPPEREAPSIGQIIEVAESWQRGFMCPLCGHDQPHEHSPREITIYRNGVKWGLKNGTEQWPWKGYPSPSKNAGHDSKGVGRQGGHGTDQHHEHRVGQSGSDRAHDQSTGRRDGIHGACDVSAKVDATPPASNAAAVRSRINPPCESCFGSGVDGDAGPDGRTIDIKCGECDGTGRAALATKPKAGDVAQDKEQAENYRLIRRGQHWSVVDGIGNTLRGDDLDAAVDAIRAARTRGEGGGA